MSDPGHVQTPHFAISHNMTSSEYQERFNTLKSQDYRLVWINVVDGYIPKYYSWHRRFGRIKPEYIPKFAAIWVRDGASVLQVARHNMTSNSYQETFDNLKERGYRLICVSGYRDRFSLFRGRGKFYYKLGVRFAALWQNGDWTDYQARHNKSSTGYQDTFDKLTSQGYKLIHVNGYFDGSQSRYAAIWSKSKGETDPRIARHRIPSEEYQSVFDDLKADGYRLKVVDAHEEKGVTRFAGLWIKKDGYKPTAHHNMSANEFLKKNIEMMQDDYQPTCVSGYRHNSKIRYAAIWVKKPRTWHVLGTADPKLAEFDEVMKEVMMDNNVPNAAAAVTYKGRLVLAKGYSWITDDMERVSPTSLFRIGSISKPITSVAILHMLENSKNLGLTDKLTKILSFPSSWNVADNRINNITVEHLLRHAGGWTRGSEAMGIDKEIAEYYKVLLPITQRTIMRYTTERLSLAFDPGTCHTYCGYGYMLLAQIIEQVSCQSYEDYVKKNILTPLGIRRMRIGRDLFQYRAPGEVLYYSNSSELWENVMTKCTPENVPKNVMRPYGTRNFVTDNSAGGWIASAVDLARFAAAFNDRLNCPILTEGSINTMFSPSPYKYDPDCHKDKMNGERTGCGWMLVPGSDGTKSSPRYHTGSLPGARARLYHGWHGEKNPDEINCAVVFNTDLDKEKDSTKEMPQKLRDVVIKKALSNIDLFDTYL